MRWVLFLQYYAKRLLWKNVSEITYFMWSGMWNLNSVDGLICLWCGFVYIFGFFWFSGETRFWNDLSWVKWDISSVIHRGLRCCSGRLTCDCFGRRWLRWWYGCDERCQALRRSHTSCRRLTTSSLLTELLILWHHFLHSWHMRVLSTSSLAFITVSTDFVSAATPLPSNRHHQRCGDCLEGKGEKYQVCSVQYCVQQLCTVRCTHIWTD